MTNLKAFKVIFCDSNNVLFSDEEYSDFLAVKGFVPSGEYLPADETKLYLCKADLLESIVTNPKRFQANRQGSIYEEVDLPTIAEEAKKIRLRFTKAVNS
jgi:hypothetical protein